ncbi:hypothetical protein OG535_06755 [Kitasatospora sp. NBC_00085]|uniref:hypothetical protein n=1 Tax=unclassified Kitasatospora TaxID=2633591 RepID=UPI0032487C7D
MTTIWSTASDEPASRAVITAVAASSTEEVLTRWPAATSSTARSSAGELSAAFGNGCGSSFRAGGKRRGGPERSLRRTCARALASPSAALGVLELGFLQGLLGRAAGCLPGRTRR